MSIEDDARITVDETELLMRQLEEWIDEIGMEHGRSITMSVCANIGAELLGMVLAAAEDDVKSMVFETMMQIVIVKGRHMEVASSAQEAIQKAMRK